jgi:pilus assembly protein Flp/PilA
MNTGAGAAQSIVHPVRQNRVNHSNLGCLSEYGAGRIPLGVDRSFFMRRLLNDFFNDRSGATSIEYAIIAGGLSIVIVAAVNGVGTALNTKFVAVSTAVK